MSSSNPFIVTIKDIAFDGTNYYVFFNWSDGAHTSPTVMSIFTSFATAAQIQTYCQVVANNQPALPASIAALVNTQITGL